MKVNVCIAIMSHLSDAQHFIDDSTKSGDMARQRINLVKMILSEYQDDITQYVDTNELDELWKVCQDKFGKPKC